MSKSTKGVHFLFIGGLVVEIFGFLLGQSENVPVVKAVMGQDMLWMEPMLEKLHDAQDIPNTDAHFEKLERLLIRDLTSPHSQFRMKGYNDAGDVRKGIVALHPRFISVHDAAAYLNFPLSRRSVRADLEGGGRVMLNMGALDAYLRNRWRRRVLWLSVLVFVAGIMMQVAGFVLDKGA